MGWVSWPLYIFVFLASFSALWWPNIWPKMGFPELFEKVLAQFISYLVFILMGWGSWPLYIFVFLASFSALWWPNIWPGQIFDRKWGFRNFLKKLLAQFISYLAFTLMGWVSWPLYIFVFLASFSALWWPNIWPKMGFPELFEKTVGSIHFIPGVYSYRVRLLTPIHFRVPGLIFGPLVAKYLAKNGVSGTFLINCWLTQFVSYLAFILMAWGSWPLYIFVFLASFSALWWPNIWLKMGFPEFFLKTVGSIHYIPGIYP